MRTVTIEFTDKDFTVREGDRYHDGLCWDEMLGMVTELTHPRLGQTKYPMLTEGEWAAWRERRLRHHQQLEQQITNHQP